MRSQHPGAVAAAAAATFLLWVNTSKGFMLYEVPKLSSAVQARRWRWRCRHGGGRGVLKKLMGSKTTQNDGKLQHRHVVYCTLLYEKPHEARAKGLWALSTPRTCASKKFAKDRWKAVPPTATIMNSSKVKYSTDIKTDCALNTFHFKSCEFLTHNFHWSIALVSVPYSTNCYKSNCTGRQ